MAATVLPTHIPTNAEASSHLVTNIPMDGSIQVKDATNYPSGVFQNMTAGTCGTVLTWPELKAGLDELREAMYGIADGELRLKIKEIVPEYGCPAHLDAKAATANRVSVARAVAHSAGA